HQGKRASRDDRRRRPQIVECPPQSAGKGGHDRNENPADSRQRDVEGERRRAHRGALALRAVTVSPPTPQLSVSISSMTTTVVAGFLFSTRWRSSVAPVINSAFCSAVAPVLVILMLT